MNAGSMIELGLHNVRMVNTRMPTILLLSTMKYDWEISINISKFSVNRLFRV